MTSELDLIRRVYAYKARTRAKYLTVIWKLPPRARYLDRGASSPSLVDIFPHVLDAYCVWFDGICARGSTPDWYPLGQRFTLGEARREMRAINGRVTGVIDSLRPGDLDRRFALPKRWRARKPIVLRELLVHMIEEELQHRGEMNALLWQAGHVPPVTEFDNQKRGRGDLTTCPLAEGKRRGIAFLPRERRQLHRILLARRLPADLVDPNRTHRFEAVMLEDWS